MKRGLALLTALWAGMSASAALAEDFAVIIANDRYKHLDRLRVVDSEYQAVAKSYEDAGFTVDLKRNVDRSEMWRALSAFETRIKDAGADADRIVIHFMGHVLPTPQNLRISSTEQLDRNVSHKANRGAGFDILYEILSVRPGEAMLVVGSPMEDIREHVARGPRVAQGVLVVAGAVSETNQLVRDAILRGAAPADLAADFPQILPESFVARRPFVGGIVATASVQQEEELRPNLEAFAEMEDWRNATDAGTAAAIEAYLAKHPNGMFAREAQGRLDALVPAEQRAEEALNLTRADRRRIQQQLTLVGYDTRGVDGIFGRGTRRAIERFQAEERFTVSGYLDITQIRVLETAARERQVELDREAEEAKRAQDAADLDAWRRFQSSRSEADLRAYVANHPEGLFIDRARAEMEKLEQERAASGNAQAAQIEAQLGLNPRTRRMVEQRLAGLKINPGPIDGTFDGQTRQAIAAFQQRAGLRATGYLTNETVGQLIASVFR